MNSIKKYRMQSLYDISSGISSSKDQAGHGAPFVSFSTVFNNYFLPDELPDKMDTSEKDQKSCSVRKGDIFITRTSETIDELAMSCVATKDYPAATFSGFVKRLRPKTQGIAYHKYLGFYLRGDLFRQSVNNNAFMTLRASFNEEIFSYLDLYLPPFDQQVAIGDLLYIIEEKKKLNISICMELESMAKMLYEYWFVQFDFPDEDGKPYKLNNGKMEWNDEVKKRIPKGWKSIQLKQLMENETISVNPKAFSHKIMEHYSIPAFDDGKFPALEYGSTIESGKYAVSKNAILVSKLNPRFKRVWDPLNLTDAAICSTEFMSLVPNNEEIRPFCFAVLNSEHYYQYLVKNAISSTGSRKRVQPDTAVEFCFAYPGDGLAKAFSDIYGPILERQKKLYIENYELTKLRDDLLPILMNGQASIVDLA